MVYGGCEDKWRTHFFKVYLGPHVCMAGTEFPVNVATVAEAPWSGAEWAVALRFDNPRATVLVLLLG